MLTPSTKTCATDVKMKHISHTFLPEVNEKTYGI